MAASLDVDRAPMRRTGVAIVAALLTPMLHVVDTRAVGQPQEPTVVFKAGVELVSVNAVVRDRRGRPVRNLTAADFEVIDGGQTRPILEFRDDLAGVSVALLFDISGSMEGQLAAAHETGTHLLGWLDGEDDEAAVFAFDARLDELLPFTAGLQRLPQNLVSMEAYGKTSLHDAIAATAGRFDDRGPRRRAVVVLTDGNDNASRLTPSEVSGIASAIDVPVYIVGLVPGVDNPSFDDPDGSRVRIDRWEALANLARWTGGNLFYASAPAARSLVARQLIDELRHQYVIAFEAGASPGWHPLIVRTRDRNHEVRARSGYFSGLSRPISQGG